MTFDALAHGIAAAIETAGILIIVLGAVVLTGLFMYRSLATRSFGEAYHIYRGTLGRAILLGLEFLVAADIVGTVVVDPTFENLGVLGLIVVIRTALSFALGVEINGHWPWQEADIALRRQALAGKVLYGRSRVPANDMRHRNLVVSSVIVKALKGLKMAYPKPAFDVASFKIE